MKLISKLLLLSFIAILACSKGKSAEIIKPFVLTTTGMLADAARQLLPETMPVKALMGPGVDPHSYKVTYGDLQLLQSAQVILYNGHDLEGKISSVLKQYSASKPCYAIAEVIPREMLIFADEQVNIADPHIWFDVKLWQLAVEEIKNRLIENFPQLRTEIESRNLRYQSQLAELDHWAKSEIGSIPNEQRLLITAHDAFSYLGKAYNIEVYGLQGISTAAEFGLFDIKRLADIIIARNIKAIFIESSVSPKFIMALQEGVQARGASVAIGGELYSDALGGHDSGADTYLGMVRANVSTIVSGLK